MRKRHLIWALVPVMAFCATPLLPFVNGPYLWLGLPSVVVWCVAWTIGTTAGLALVERFAQSPEDRSEEDRTQHLTEETAR